MRDQLLKGGEMEGGFASRFWLIQSGHAVLVHVPENGRSSSTRWAWASCLAVPGCARRTGGRSARSAPASLEAFEFDAAAVRPRCAADPVFGYELQERLIRVLARRLQATSSTLLRSGEGSAVAGYVCPAARACPVSADRRDWLGD